jgi:hypothetical protein
VNADATQILNVLTGDCSAVCCTDKGKLEQIKQKALQALQCEAARASATTRVGDEAWDYGRFFDAITKLIEWLDARCDKLDPIGFVQSEGPQCLDDRSCQYPELGERWPL